MPDQLPSQMHQRLEVRSVAGGINTRFATTQLEDDEVSDMENFHIEARGGVERRRGYGPHVNADTPTTDGINGLWKHKDPTNEKVVRVQDGEIHSSTIQGGAWTDINDIGGTPETISSSLTDLVKAQVYRRYSIFTDGVNPLLKWDGSSDVELAEDAIDGGADTIDSAYTMVLHEERIILGNVGVTLSGTPEMQESGIWPSEAGTLDSWEEISHVGHIQIEEGDGDKITNLQSIFGFLVVFKEGSLHRIENYGVSAQQTRKKVAAVGTPGKHTAVVVGPLVYFLDRTGRLWIYDSRGENEDSVVEVSAPKLGPETFEEFNTDALEQAHLHYEPRRQEIYAFIPEAGSSVPTLAWVYNTLTGDSEVIGSPLEGSFYKMRWGDNFSMAFSTVDGDGAPLFLGGTDDGLVVHLNKSTTLDDNGTDFTPYYETRWMDLEARWAVKGLRDLDLFTNVEDGQTIKVTVKFDFADSGTEYNVVVAGQGDTLG